MTLQCLFSKSDSLKVNNTPVRCLARNLFTETSCQIKVGFCQDFDDEEEPLQEMKVKRDIAIDEWALLFHTLLGVSVNKMALQIVSVDSRFISSNDCSCS